MQQNSTKTSSYYKYELKMGLSWNEGLWVSKKESHHPSFSAVWYEWQSVCKGCLCNLCNPAWIDSLVALIHRGGPEKWSCVFVSEIKWEQPHHFCVYACVCVQACLRVTDRGMLRASLFCPLFHPHRCRKWNSYMPLIHTDTKWTHTCTHVQTVKEWRVL